MRKRYCTVPLLVRRGPFSPRSMQRRARWARFDKRVEKTLTRGRRGQKSRGQFSVSLRLPCQELTSNLGLTEDHIVRISVQNIREGDGYERNWRKRSAKHCCHSARLRSLRKGRHRDAEDPVLGERGLACDRDRNIARELPGRAGNP